MWNQPSLGDWLYFGCCHGHQGVDTICKLILVEDLKVSNIKCFRHTNDSHSASPSIWCERHTLNSIITPVCLYTAGTSLGWSHAGLMYVSKDWLIAKEKPCTSTEFPAMKWRTLDSYYASYYFCNGCMFIPDSTNDTCWQGHESVSCPMGDRADLSYPLSNTHTHFWWAFSCCFSCSLPCWMAWFI